MFTSCILLSSCQFFLFASLTRKDNYIIIIRIKLQANIYNMCIHELFCNIVPLRNECMHFEANCECLWYEFERVLSCQMYIQMLISCKEETICLYKYRISSNYGTGCQDQFLRKYHKIKHQNGLFGIGIQLIGCGKQVNIIKITIFNIELAKKEQI